MRLTLRVRGGKLSAGRVDRLEKGKLVMISWGRTRRIWLTLAVGVAAGLAAPASGWAATHLKLIAPTYSGLDVGIATVRTADGTLHLAYPTRHGGGGNTGLASRTISAAGTVGPQVQALSNWGVSVPALVALPNGTLWMVFGAIPPIPKPSGIWGISSPNGGASWSAPVLVGSGSPLEALAYGASFTARMLGATPWLTINVAGGLTLQQGLGSGAPTVAVNTPGSFDGSLGDVNSAVDASAAELVASWQSLATPGGDFIQGVAPATQAAKHVPGQRRSAVVVAGRDKGAGVFAAYTPDNIRVRLYRYGGGTVAVGKVSGLTAKILGVATGKDGRIWVMWGDDSKREVAVSRSNKTVTRFGAIQLVKDNAFDLWRYFGDGTLGPLDLFVDQTPVKPLVERSYYARVMPALSADTTVHQNKTKGSYKLTVKVTDAGSAISGATVSAKGKTAKTNGQGVVTMTVHGSKGSKVKVKVTAPGYGALHRKVKL